MLRWENFQVEIVHASEMPWKHFCSPKNAPHSPDIFAGFKLFSDIFLSSFQFSLWFRSQALQIFLFSFLHTCNCLPAFESFFSWRANFRSQNQILCDRYWMMEIMIIKNWRLTLLEDVMIGEFLSKSILNVRQEPNDLTARVLTVDLLPIDVRSAPCDVLLCCYFSSKAK